MNERDAGAAIMQSNWKDEISTEQMLEEDRSESTLAVEALQELLEKTRERRQTPSSLGARELEFGTEDLYSSTAPRPSESARSKAVGMRMETEQVDREGNEFVKSHKETSPESRDEESLDESPGPVYFTSFEGSEEEREGREERESGEEREGDGDLEGEEGGDHIARLEASARRRGDTEWRARLRRETSTPYDPDRPETWRGEYNAQSTAVLREIMGADSLQSALGGLNLSDNPGDGTQPPDDSDRNAYYIRQFMRARNPEERARALRDLQEEVTKGGNPYALEALRALSLVDAVQRLRAATTPEARRDALRTIAGLELGEQQGSRDILTGFIDGDRHTREAEENLNEGARAARRAEREAAVESARAHADSRRTGARFTDGQALLDVVNGNAEQRANAIREMERAVVQNGLNDRIDDRLASELARARVSHAVANISEATDPLIASRELQSLITFSSRGNQLASQILRDRLPRADQIYTQLTSPDAATREAALRQLQAALRPVEQQRQDLRRLSPADILRQFGERSADEVREAREHIEQWGQQNFDNADRAIATYLNRESTDEQRTEALRTFEQLAEQRMTALRADNFNDLGRRLRANELVTPLRAAINTALEATAGFGNEEERHLAAEDVRRALESMITAGLDTGASPGNPSVREMLVRLGTREQINQLITELGNPERREQTLRTILERLPNPQTTYDEMRTGRIIRALENTSTSQQWSEAVDSLRDESENHNRMAARWLEWAEPMRNLSRLQEATTPEQAREAMQALAQAARAGNLYARAALASSIMGGMDEAQRNSWYAAGYSEVNGKPAFIPALNSAVTGNAVLMHELRTIALGAMREALDDEDSPGLTGGEAAAIAHAVSQAQTGRASGEQGVPRANQINELALPMLREALADTEEVNGQQRPTESSIETVRALTSILTSTVPGREALVDTFMTASKHPEFAMVLERFHRTAFLGDVPSLRVLSHVAAGATERPYSAEAARRALELAGRNPDVRRATITELLQVNTARADRAQLLATLGTLAGRETSIGDPVRTALQAGIRSENAQMRRSAIEGLMNAAERWTNADVTFIRQNLTPEIIAQLPNAIDKMPPAQRTELIRLCMEPVTNRENIAGSHEQAARELQNCISVLAIAGRHLTRQQVVALGQFGESAGQRVEHPDFRTAAGVTGLTGRGFTNEESRAIQNSAGRALLSILGRVQAADAQQAAFGAFAQLNWPGVANSEVRNALVRYVRGDGGEMNLELLEQVQRLMYDANVPSPVAGIFREVRPGLTNAQYYERANRAIENYRDQEQGGAEFVRAVVGRAQTWNSLDPWFRRDLTGSAAPLADGQRMDMSQRRIDFALFNSLPAEIREQLTGSRDQLRGDRAMPSFEGKFITAAAFNRLSPELRRQLTGRDEDINMAQLEGVLFNGQLQQRYSFLMNNGISGGALDRAVRDARGRADDDLAFRTASQERLARERDQALNRLTGTTRQGPGFLRTAGNVISLGGLIFESPLDEWERNQNGGVRRVRELDDRIAETGRQVHEQSRRSSAFGLADDSGRYTTLWHTGERFQADQLSLRMYRDYGPDIMRAFTPQALTNLTERSGGGRVGRSGLERMRDQGIVSMTELPRFGSDPAARFGEALTQLRAFRPTQPNSLDAQAARQTLMRAIDCDAGINALADAGRAINTHLRAIDEMYKSGKEGKKYQEFVDDVKRRGEELRRALSAITPEQITAVRARVRELEQALPSINDPESARIIRERIRALNGMIDICNPASETRRGLDQMLTMIRSRDFNADTFGNWLSENAIVIAASVGAAIICVASMGTASPLAVLLVSSAVAVGASHIARESLYQINHLIGDTGLGRYEDRSPIGRYVEDTALRAGVFFVTMGDRSVSDNFSAGLALMGERGWAGLRDVAGPVGLEYLMNVSMGLGCLGLGHLATHGMRGGLSREALRTLYTSRAASQIATQMETAAAVGARNPASQSFMREWLGRVRGETVTQTGFTVAQEGLTHLAESGLHVGHGNNALSFGVSAMLAIAQGRYARRHLRAARGNEVHVTPEFEAALLSQLRRDGHQIREVRPGHYEVTPFTARHGDPPIIVRRAPEVHMALPHELPANQRDNARANASRLGTDGAWMTSAVREMHGGNYQQAYENARNASTKPANLDINGVALPAMSAADIIAGRGVTEHINGMRTVGEAIRTPEGRFVINEPRTQVRLSDGVIVDVLNPRRAADGRALNLTQQAEMNRVVESANGRRIVAEHAFTMMEEMFHIRQYAERGTPLSQTFREFAERNPGEIATRDADNPMGRTRDSLEREFMAALSDAGVHPELLRQHFEGQYTGRRSIMDFIRQRAGIANPPEAPVRPGGPEAPLIGPDGRLVLRREQRVAPPENVQTEADILAGRSGTTGDMCQLQGSQIIRDLLQRRAPGWELVECPSQSAGDRVGIDYMLRNTTTGEWLPLDISTRAKPGRQFTITLPEGTSPTAGWNGRNRRITAHGEQLIERFLFGDPPQNGTPRFIQDNLPLAQALGALDNGRTPPIRDILRGAQTTLNATERQTRIQEFITACENNPALRSMREHAQRALAHANNEVTLDRQVGRAVDDFVLGRRQVDVPEVRSNVEIDVHGRVIGFVEGSPWHSGTILEHVNASIERMRARTDLSPAQDARLTRLEEMHTRASERQQVVSDLHAGLEALNRGAVADANLALNADAANPAALRRRATEALQHITQPAELVAALRHVETHGTFANNGQRRAYLEARLAQERQALRPLYNEFAPLVREHLVWSEYGTDTTRAAAFADRTGLSPTVGEWARHQAQWEAASARWAELPPTAARDFLPESWSGALGAPRPASSRVEQVSNPNQAGAAIIHGSATYYPRDISHYDTATRSFITTSGASLPLSACNIRLRVQAGANRDAQSFHGMRQIEAILRREQRVTAEMARLGTELPEITHTRDRVRDRLRNLDLGDAAGAARRWGTFDGNHLNTSRELNAQWGSMSPAEIRFMETRLLNLTEPQKAALRRHLETLRNEGVTVQEAIEIAAS